MELKLRFVTGISLALLCLVVGCGRGEMYQTKIDTARRQLRLVEDTPALETLGVSDDSDAPAEFHYLKAIALERLNRHEAAVSEIKRATTADPTSAKYKAYELKLRLFARDRESLEQLLKLSDDYGSLGSVALFVTYAHQAKGVLLEAERKPKAAEYHFDRKKRTFATALTLAHEIPEWHRELIIFALQEQQQEEAMKLIDGILKVDPKNLPMRNKKLQVLLALKKNDDAVLLARELFDESQQQMEGAEAYAAVLSLGEVNERHDLEFQKLQEKYPRSLQIICRRAAYMTRGGNLLDAFKLLDDAMPGQPTKSARETLAYASITLPLEIGNADFAEQRLQKCRSEISDPLLVEYFEARLLYLKRQYSEAVRKMLNIVAAEKKNPGKSSALALDALTWVRRILADRVMSDQINVAIDKSEKTIKPGPQPEPKAQPEPPKPEPRSKPEADTKPAPVSESSPAQVP